MNFIILFRKKHLIDGKLPSKEDESSDTEKEEEDIPSKKGKTPKKHKVIKTKKKKFDSNFSSSPGSDSEDSFYDDRQSAQTMQILGIWKTKFPRI
jgi:hypothetical protein